MNRTVMWTVILGFAVSVALACAGAGYVLHAEFYLLLGWLFFLIESASKVAINWSGVLSAAGALIGFLVGGHFLARSLIRPADADSPPRVWRGRWTVAATAGIVLMFVAGIAAIGFVHQVTWLARSKEAIIYDASARQASFRSQSKNNLKQMGLAFYNALDAHGSFPAGATFDTAGRPMHSWVVELLPYLDRMDLYTKIDRDVPWDDPQNAPPFRTVLDVLLNPRLRDNAKSGHPEEPALIHYAANGWVVGGGSRLDLQSISDGVSNTILAGEVKSAFRAWGDPLNWRDPKLGINRSPAGFGGPWEGGAHFLLGDGSVRFISDKVDQSVLDALATSDGGEVVGEF